MRKMLTNGRFVLVLVVLTAAGVLVARELAGQNRNGGQAPYFEVDPLWPKPLPNHWILGSTIGVSVDERDHVWIIHRGSATLGNNEKGLELNPPTGECCAGAPPVLEFDPEGNLVGHWGGPGEGYEWPASNHGITIDHKGNVWIGGNGAEDSQVLKFTQSRQVPAAGRQVERAQGTEQRAGAADVRRRQQRSDLVRPRREDLRRPDCQRGVSRRRLPEQARRDRRRRHGQAETVLGRLRQQAGRHQPRSLQARGAARAAVPQPGALRRSVAATASSTSATGRTTGSRCSRRKASSSRKRSSRRTA